jgi:choline kinase
MRAVILAAGQGTRLGVHAEGMPKSLVSVGGLSLIERSLGSLHRVGFDEAFVVVGYQHDIMEQFIRARFDPGFCKILVNSDYVRGSGTSLIRAADALQGNVLLLEADLLYHDQVLKRMTLPTVGNALAMGHFKHSYDEGKLRVRDGFVESISWGGPDIVADGDWVGMTKLSPEASSTLREALCRESTRDGGEIMYTPFICDLIGRFQFSAVPIDDLPWIEIDNAADLARARAEIAHLL